jgi:phospholipase/carboxylesterase
MKLKDYRLAPLSGAAPDNTVVFLHGLGDNGSGGLLEIGRIWQRTLPTTEFICPDAPFAYDMAPLDFGGRQWFSLRDFSPVSVERGVRTAAPILDAYIDGILVSRNLKPNKLALVGFSQGTMMALHVGLRRTEPIAALLGYSGMLSAPGSLNAEKKSAPPILLIHGVRDEVVPFAAMEQATTALKAADIQARMLACPNLGHSIDDAGIAAGMQFLQQYL